MFFLVGGDSAIGATTYRSLTTQGQPVIATTRRRQHVARDRPFLDLAAPLADWEPPTDTRAACVFAGITRLAACQADPADSGHVNVTQTLSLIERLLARDAFVLFLSTNQVFDGGMRNVPADAPACPISEYGRQKAQVEMALLDYIARSAPVAILRLGKVVAPDMPPLFHNWIQALSVGMPMRAFYDMSIAPTPINLVCTAIGALLKDRVGGIYQLTGPRDVTYAEVARFLADRVGSDPCLISEISALDSGLPPGATPQHTTLDSSRLRERYGLMVPDAWAVIDAVFHNALQARTTASSADPGDQEAEGNGTTPGMNPRDVKRAKR